MNSEFKAIEVSWDEALLKRRAVPQTVKITSQDFDDYLSEYCSNSRMLIRNAEWLYDKMPSKLTGKFRYKDSSWDFMETIYYRPSMIAAVSEKVKNIIEYLGVSHNEYVLKPISIEGCDTPYYLMFVKKIPDSELIYPDSKFRGVLGEKAKHKYSFNNYTERSEASGFEACGIEICDIVLPASYQCRDIISIQTPSPCYFSQRIIDAFERNKIKGFSSYSPKNRTLNFIK